MKASNRDRNGEMVLKWRDGKFFSRLMVIFLGVRTEFLQRYKARFASFEIKIL